MERRDLAKYVVCPRDAFIGIQHQQLLRSFFEWDAPPRAAAGSLSSPITFTRVIKEFFNVPTQFSPRLITPR